MARDVELLEAVEALPVDAEKTRAEVERRLAQLEIAERVGRLGAWEWSIDDDVVLASDALERIVGTCDGIALEAFAALLSPDAPDVVTALVRALEGGGDVQTREVACGPRHLVVSAELVPAHDAVGSRVVGVVQDVTGQRRAQVELWRAQVRANELAALTAELERSNAELDQFAYVASHDLKAPLRGIANLVTWITEDLGDDADGDTRKHLELMSGRVYRMEALIDALLAYARVGRKDGAPESVDVAALVHEVIELLAPPADVEVAVAGQLPALISPRAPLRQVFHNLIGNAIKHARRQGPGRIEVGARDAGDAVEFYVADDGPGIDPRYHDRIFGVFQTLETRDKVEGAGIGLALVKKNVQRRGGRVWVESTAGAGATFRFTWPKEGTSP